MKPLVWGAVSALIFTAVYLACRLSGTVMPGGFANMSPVALVGAGFFWGAVLCLVRDKIGPKHAQ